MAKDVSVSPDLLKALRKYKRSHGLHVAVCYIQARGFPSGVSYDHVKNLVLKLCKAPTKGKPHLVPKSDLECLTKFFGALLPEDPEFLPLTNQQRNSLLDLIKDLGWSSVVGGLANRLPPQGGESYPGLKQEASLLIEDMIQDSGDITYSARQRNALDQLLREYSPKSNSELTSMVRELTNRVQELEDSINRIRNSLGGISL